MVQRWREYRERPCAGRYAGRAVGMCGRSAAASAITFAAAFGNAVRLRSYHPDVLRRDCRRTLDGGDELSLGAALTVGVVVELTGARVVDQPIVGIVPRARPGCGIEATIAGAELAGGAEPAEGAAIEAQHVPG